MTTEYDVALSFAGEQRTIVQTVAERLRAAGLKVFYDEFETSALWGKNLLEHLDWVYRVAARYTVIFLSADYERKAWTRFEARSALARALDEKREYVLPVRIDDTELPGLHPTVGYVDARITSTDELADLIATKVT